MKCGSLLQIWIHGDNTFKTRLMFDTFDKFELITSIIFYHFMLLHRHWVPIYIWCGLLHSITERRFQCRKSCLHSPVSLYYQFTIIRFACISELYAHPDKDCWCYFGENRFRRYQLDNILSFHVHAFHVHTIVEWDFFYAWYILLFGFILNIYKPLGITGVPMNKWSF